MHQVITFAPLFWLTKIFIFLLTIFQQFINNKNYEKEIFLIFQNDLNYINGNI